MRATWRVPWSWRARCSGASPATPRCRRCCASSRRPCVEARAAAPYPLRPPGRRSHPVSRPLRLRFAPSPTGRLHIGGARTALFNWAYARGRGGAFLLRVEDTDRERSTPEFERAILDGLGWLGLNWDEGPDVGGAYGPYRQSERGELYARHARHLLETGHAYRCFCSAERLDALREQQSAAKQRIAYDRSCAAIPREEAERRAAQGEANVVRFLVPTGETRFSDHVRGDVAFDNAEVDDWIMLRSDGSPTYNFVVVCDDVDMQISHVFR